MQTRAHVFVSGRVQGVFFRQKTMQEARSLGVNGWVRNLDDGRVEAIFEGEQSAVKALLEFCSKGPKGALVTNVSVSWETFKGEFRSFDIVY
jgi:acylphosphatase